MVVFPLRSHVQETLSVYNSSEALCRFTLTEHACSSVSLFYVSYQSQNKVWLLLHEPPETNCHRLWETLLYFLSISFQGYTSNSQQLGHIDEMHTGKQQDIPDRGLEAFIPKSFSWTRQGSWDIRNHGKCHIITKLVFSRANSVKPKLFSKFQAPGNSKPSLSHALEALGEVRIANFSQTQLQSDDFVSSWFQTNIRPFLASTTPNFLFCLSSKNFSCETYQTV